MGHLHDAQGSSPTHCPYCKSPIAVTCAVGEVKDFLCPICSKMLIVRRLGPRPLLFPNDMRTEVDEIIQTIENEETDSLVRIDLVMEIEEMERACGDGS